MSRRRGVQRQQREWDEQVARERAERARRDGLREFGALLMSADEHTLALIEQFGMTALRAQWAENAKAYQQEVERMQRTRIRRAFADALALAQESAPVSARFVLYTESRRWWSPTNVLGQPCMSGHHDRPEVARERARAELAKLGIDVEYANPNAAGEGVYPSPLPQKLQ
jgi:hypothetical protein